MTHPTDNLVRARYDMRAAEFRNEDADGDGRTLHGMFAVFNEWTEIDSYFEGRFLERISPEAFNRTFTERGDRVRILYDHGADPSIGNKPLGAPDVLRVDDVGAHYESRLFDTSYVADLVPALAAGQLGASFRFRVTGESWVDPSESTEWNPSKLPERTIDDLDLYELGPVTFPAYESATAGVRSTTDAFLQRLTSDPMFLARFTERAGVNVVEKVLEASADGDVSTTSANGSTVGQRNRTPAQRRALVALAGVSI